MAIEARRNAYCPYSRYAVGASIGFHVDGQERTAAGCNVENVSFGLSICAERNAIFRAVADCGRIELRSVVVATQDGGTPCGACLQVIHEFAVSNCAIWCVNENQDVRAYSLHDLLPAAFATREF